MSVSIDFNSIKDFEPENVARKVPELNKLLELRQALTALKGPLSNVPEFRKKVQSLVKDDTVRDQLLKELGVEE
jgi:type VI secretion system protein ImpB